MSARVHKLKPRQEPEFYLDRGTWFRRVPTELRRLLKEDTALHYPPSLSAEEVQERWEAGK